MLLATLITLPENMVASIMTYASDLFESVSLIVILVIGLPLGFWLARRVIGLVRAR